MHILIIPSWYKSITEPVLGTFFEEQARALMSAGHKVGIIYPQFSSVSSMFNKKDEIIDFYDDTVYFIIESISNLLPFIQVIQHLFPILTIP